MKISPVAQGSGVPGQNLTADIGRTASPDKMARAKAIARGENPITVSESDTPVDPQVKRAQESIRKIKMKTNASPDRFNPLAEPIQEPSEDPQTPESAISDPSAQVNEAEDTKPLSPQFAALAKQRRALQVKERELAEREKALQAQPQSGSDDLVARLKSEPLRVLQEHGVTYDQLTDAILSNQNVHNPEIQELKAEIKALKEGVDKSLSDRDAQAEQAVLAEMRREAVLLAKSGDTYEMVRETNSVPDVIQLIHRTYKQTGEVLDVSEAMQLVEDELINESLKIAKIKKVQSKLSPQPEPQQIQQQQPRQMRTLTNRDSARTPMSRRERAIAAMTGTLKK